jgi:hypothetical protein
MHLDNDFEIVEIYEDEESDRKLTPEEEKP